MSNNVTYSDSIEKIRQQLALALKDSLPASYTVNTSNAPWTVSVDNKGQVSAKDDAEKSGFYIGASIDSLSLSDLALLIDGFPKGSK